MRILLDHCTPKRLRRLLPVHFVRTTREMGWERLLNGRLLSAAEGQFDVMLTVDRSIRFQQNMATRTISVIVMRANNNRFESLGALIPAVEKALDVIGEGVVVEVSIDDVIEES